MASKVTLFRAEWLTNPKYSTWLEKTSVSTEAYCKHCHKNIDLLNMGRGALESHMKGQKHSDASGTNSGTIKSFFKEQGESSSASIEGKQLSIKEFGGDYAASDAEIRWVMNLVKKHSSYRSVEHDLEAMCTMFLDSQIVQERMKLGKTKCMYMCVYGLGMYFYSHLLTQVKASPHYTISFYESLNTKLQECQMDIIVRYQDAESAEVKV